MSRIPRYSEGNKQWDVVPIESASWDECERLVERGSRVALLIFCPYHARPLTCELVGPEIRYRGRQRPISTTRGAGTDFMNVDLSRFRSLTEFLVEELAIPRNLSQPLQRNLLAEARERPLLQVEHDRRSEDTGKEPRWLDP